VFIFFTNIIFIIFNFIITVFTYFYFILNFYF